MQTYSFSNQKGGVSKSTSAVNVAAGLALAGKRVLLVDMDPQSSSTFSLTGREHPERNMYQVLTDNRPIQDVFVATDTEGLTIAPSDLDLAGAEVELLSEAGSQVRLRAALPSNFDFCIIDTPPSLGLLTINALAASDGVIIPIDCKFFSLRGIVRLEEIITKTQQYYQAPKEILGVLCTRFNRTNVAKDAVAAIRQRFGDKAFQTVIPENVKLEEAHSHAQHIFDYAPTSAGADAYQSLVKEILIHG